MKPLMHLVLALGFGLTAPLFAKDEVSLLSVMNVPMSKYGMSWLVPQVRVKVQNLAYEKRVKIVFTATNGQVNETEAQYLSPADAGYEVWEGATNLQAGDEYEVHVEYEAAGRSYKTPAVSLKAGPVFYAAQNVQQILYGRQFYGQTANFTVGLRNLAYAKRVQAHVSCDDFRSSLSVDLSFQPYFMYGYGVVQSPTPEGFEIWTGSTHALPEGCGIARYYYTYDIDGQRFADTNFGQNYVMYRQ
jgi:hypothetical protein